MRALKHVFLLICAFFFIFIVIIISFAAMADEQVSLDASLNESPSVRASYRHNGILNALNLSALLNTTYADYTEYLIYNNVGEPSKLGYKTVEVSTGMGAELQLPMVTLYANGGGLLNNSPMRSYGYSVGGDFSPNQQLTVIGLQHSYLLRKTPSSWVARPDDFKMVLLPSTVHATEERIKFTQALNENVKIGVDLMTVLHKDARPRSYGVAVKLGVAITDSVYFKQVTTKFWDSEQKLNYDRGYFRLDHTDLELGYEPTYNLLLSAAYSFQLEGEFDPRSNKYKSVGSNGVAGGIRYATGNYEYRMNLTVFKPETETTKLSLGLGITKTL
jgi:hypothetical protein